MAKADRIECVQYWDVPDDVYSSRGWDFAGSKKKGSAFTANARVGISESSGFVYIFDAWMDQYLPNELEDEIKSVATLDGPGVRQSMPRDPAQAGLFQAHVLSNLLQGHTFEFTPETGSKEDRFRPFASQVNASKVKIVIDSRKAGPRTNWIARPSTKIVPSVLVQIGTFPAGKYKDLCDAISRAYMDACMGRTLDAPIPGAVKVATPAWKVENPYGMR
jgi:phage terminase large subunit-like protein